jgi:iron complex outermembrane receptor protein
MEYQQTNAVLSGVDISTLIKPVPALEWVSKISYLHARNKKINDWLILMPANRLSNEIKYSLKECKKITDTYISAEIQNIMQQKNVPSDASGKQDYKAPPNAYTIVGMNASATLHVYKTPVTISIGVRNLLNTVYRDYLNSMRYFSDEMGRNISVRAKIQLQ